MTKQDQTKRKRKKFIPTPSSQCQILEFSPRIVGIVEEEIDFKHHSESYADITNHTNNSSKAQEIIVLNSNEENSNTGKKTQEIVKHPIECVLESNVKWDDKKHEDDNKQNKDVTINASKSCDIIEIKEDNNKISNNDDNPPPPMILKNKKWYPLEITNKITKIGLFKGKNNLGYVKRASPVLVLHQTSTELEKLNCKNRLKSR